MIFKLLNQVNFTEINKLVEEGNIDLTQANEFGNTPLHVACKVRDKGNVELVKLFLNSGLEFDINAEGIDGFTPLQYAVSSGNNEIVKVLLENGASVNKPDNSGATPIMNAVAQYDNDDSVIKTLLENGADTSIANNYDITLFKLLDMPKNKAVKPLFEKIND